MKKRYPDKKYGVYVVTDEGRDSTLRGFENLREVFVTTKVLRILSILEDLNS
jgi:hypothetical protein